MTTESFVSNLARSIVSFALVFLYYTGVLILMELNFYESVRFGVMIGIGCAVVVFFFYDGDSPGSTRWKNRLNGNSRSQY